MASFNFKSSGVKIDDRTVSNDLVTKKTRDVGIKTPLTSNQDRQIFDMHVNPADQLKDNLKNLVLTNFGERLGLYDFGADLQALLFELGSNPSVESEAADRIEKAVQKYMPGIDIVEISQVDLDRNEKNLVNIQSMAKVRLRITYNIPSARISNQAIEVTLQHGG